MQIWKIYGTKTLNDNFSRYRLGVERTRNISEGNTCRRFHGTARKCLLGDDDRNRDMCNDGGCSLCSIIAVRVLSYVCCLCPDCLVDLFRSRSSGQPHQFWPLRAGNLHLGDLVESRLSKYLSDDMSDHFLGR
jgi:hypothetical protein